MTSNARLRIPVPLATAALLALAACGSPPIAVHRVSPSTAYAALTRNALSQGEPSLQTLVTLRRHGLTRTYATDPARAIAQLHEDATREEVPQAELVALAELSFLEARRAANRAATRPPRRRGGGLTAAARGIPPAARGDEGRDERLRQSRDARSRYLAATVYAYTFLASGRPDQGLDPLDPRVRLAGDLYDEALAEAFLSPDGAIHPRSGRYPLPFGHLDLRFDPADLAWGRRRLTDLIPVSRLEVEGLRNRYRRPGIGAPLAAKTRPRVQTTAASDELVPRRTLVPATLLLRLEDPRSHLATGHLRGRLEVHTDEADEAVSVAGRELPLEADHSAALAATLDEVRPWEDELARFLGRALRLEDEARLFAWMPHRPGRIPIVFIHGTASDPSVWANMVNDLEADPEIRRRFEYWFFRYDSGNPILYSAFQLRRALRHAVALLDPKRSDPCLRELVLVGHSQGGLLTKLMVVDPGDVFWRRLVGPIPFAQAELAPDTRALLEEGLFFHPLPFVRRVVFISTPHHGSFLAAPRVLRWLASSLITLPADLLRLPAQLARAGGVATRQLADQSIATSIDNMSPHHPAIEALAELPISPRVTAHSIISVQGEGPPEQLDDGVVSYASAHLEGVASELVVRSGHSCQSNPHTIAEVSRILREHAEAPACGAASAVAYRARPD